jgi:hypothetical protein
MVSSVSRALSVAQRQVTGKSQQLKQLNGNHLLTFLGISDKLPSRNVDDTG